jgi:hypothetical protein
LAEPERVGEIIARRTRIDPRGKRLRLAFLKNSWPSLAGERMAEHSRPTRLSRGTLTISADGTAWAGELSAVTNSIEKNIEKVLGEGAVKKIRVLARDWREEQRTIEDETSDERGKEYVDGEMCEVMVGLDDADVREALGKMVRASRTSKQNKQGCP